MLTHTCTMPWCPLGKASRLAGEGPAHTEARQGHATCDLGPGTCDLGPAIYKAQPNSTTSPFIALIGDVKAIPHFLGTTLLVKTS